MNSMVQLKYSGTGTKKKGRQIAHDGSFISAVSRSRGIHTYASRGHEEFCFSTLKNNDPNQSRTAGHGDANVNFQKSSRLKVGRWQHDPSISKLVSYEQSTKSMLDGREVFREKSWDNYVDIVPPTLKKRYQQEMPPRISLSGTSTPDGLKPRRSIEETVSKLGKRLKDIDLNSNIEKAFEKRKKRGDARFCQSKDNRTSSKENTLPGNIPATQNISISSSDFTVYKFEESDASVDGDQEEESVLSSVASSTRVDTAPPVPPEKNERRVYNWNGHPRITPPAPLNTGYRFLNQGRSRSRTSHDDSYQPNHHDFNLGYTYLNHFHTDQATVNESWNSTSEDESNDTSKSSCWYNEWQQYEKYKDEQTQKTAPTLPSTVAGHLPGEGNDDDSDSDVDNDNDDSKEESFRSHHVLLKKEQEKAEERTPYDFSPYGPDGDDTKRKRGVQNEDDDEENDGKSLCANQSWISDISQIRSTCTHTSNHMITDKGCLMPQEISNFLEISENCEDDINESSNKILEEPQKKKCVEEINAK